MKNYKILIESAIKESVSNFGANPLLRNSCEYALLNGGKRFRPSISLMIADTLNPTVDITQAALAVEYFHTASLIADDLPCMDDDDFRRNKPALHKLQGEAVALLTTYALIAEGYRCLWKNADSIAHSNLPFAHSSDKICALALENATYNTGVHGATGGQVLDIIPQDFSLEIIKEIIHKKTTSLFEISFVLGWLYGGGFPDKLEIVKKAAKHFGLAFQIADDIDDSDQDRINGRKVNIANLFGIKKAEALLEEETSHYIDTLHSLQIATQPLIKIADFFTHRN